MAGSRSAPGLAVALSLLVGGCSFFQDFDFGIEDASVDRDGAVDANAMMDAADAGVPDSGGDGSVADGGSTLTREDFLQQYSERLCSKLLECESKAGLGAVLELVCHPEYANIIQLQSFGRPEKWEFRPDRAAQCLEQVSRPSCNLQNGVLSFRTKDTPCETAFEGTVANGGTCFAQGECANGYCANMEQCGGTCMAYVESGGSCEEDEQCAPGLICRDGTCQQPGTEDELCSGSGDCGTFLWCNPDAGTLPDGGTGGACKPLPGQDDPCESSLGFDPCRAGLLCHFDDDVCVVGQAEGESCAYPERCQPGLRCTDADECFELVEPGEPCDKASQCPVQFVCPAGTCEPKPVLGQSCDPLRPCINGTCQDGECQYLSADEECDSSLECEGYCDTDVDPSKCRAPLSEGEACNDNAQCDSGMLCIEGQCTPCAAADLLPPLF